MNLPASLIRTIVTRFPAVVSHLKGRARWAVYASRRKPKWYSEHGYSLVATFDFKTGWNTYYEWNSKTYDYYLSTLERMVRNVYNGNMAGDFIDVMANLISGQINQAFEQAWTDEGDESGYPDYLAAAAEDMILSEYDHVDGFYRSIVDARVDGTPIEPLLARCVTWANRWNDAYNLAVSLITKEMGGNLEWVYADENEHCPECLALNGIVARASVWDELGIRPQNPPNSALTCGGWRCGCELRPTDRRQSPNAYDSILNIVSR